MQKKISLLLIIFILSIIFGCNSHSIKADKEITKIKKHNEMPVKKDPVELKKKEILEGKEVYEKFCVKCHGKEAKGGGEGDGILGIPTRDLTDKAYMQHLSDDDLYERIAFGDAKFPHIVMPGWSYQISKNTIYKIIKYVRSMEIDQGPLKGLSPKERITKYENDAIVRGGVNYNRYCSHCHGLKGDGRGWKSGKLTSIPIDFTESEFRTKYSRKKIFDYVKGIGEQKKSRVMPVFGTSIKTEVVSDIINYLFTFQKTGAESKTIDE
jgi:mono/diheme cytochrome c family protein